MSPTLKTHLDAIRAGAITKTNVIGIRKAINHVERIARGWSGNRSSATVDDVSELESALELAKPIVRGELHDSGLRLLRGKRYAKRLASVAGIIESLEHFRLIGFTRIGQREEYAIPVYMAISKTGRSFTFRNIPWQSAWSTGEESGPVILSTSGGSR